MEIFAFFSQSFQFTLHKVLFMDLPKFKDPPGGTTTYEFQNNYSSFTLWKSNLAKSKP